MDHQTWMDVKDRIIFKSSYIGPEHSSINCSQFTIYGFFHDNTRLHKLTTRNSRQKPSWCLFHLPAQHTQHKVEDKKGSKDDQAYKVDPGQLKTDGIIHLPKENNKLHRIASTIYFKHSFIHLQLALYPGLGHSGFKTYHRNTRHNARIHLR